MIIAVRQAVLLFGILICLVCPNRIDAQQPSHSGEGKISSRQQAELLLRRGRFEEAVQTARKAIESGNDDGYLFRVLASAYTAAERANEAEKYIHDYLIHHPQSTHAWYGLGFVHYLKKDASQAETAFHRAIELDSDNALAWNNWGAVLADEKRYTEAVEKVKQAIVLDPSELMFYRNLEKIYRDMGKDGLFFAEFKEYESTGPEAIAVGYGKTVARSLRQQGFRSYSQGNLDEAINKFSEMADIYRNIKHDPGLVPALFSLGLLYEEKGDVPSAQKYFKEVLAINPDHIQAREKVDSGL